MRHNSESSPEDLLPESPRFAAASRALEASGVWSALAQCGARDPTLVGTIPLGVDLPESDLDIVCERPADRDVDEFTDDLITAITNTVSLTPPDRPHGGTIASGPHAKSLQNWRRPGAVADQPAVVARFRIPADHGAGVNPGAVRIEAIPDEHFVVEIFADVLAVADQMAGRHYRVEYELLQQARRDGRLIAAQMEIRRLKRGGLSTERAFCEYFGIEIAKGSDEFRTLYEYAPKIR